MSLTLLLVPEPLDRRSGADPRPMVRAARRERMSGRRDITRVQGHAP
jgi:hypothetical protein